MTKAGKEKLLQSFVDYLNNDFDDWKEELFHSTATLTDDITYYDKDRSLLVIDECINVFFEMLDIFMVNYKIVFSVVKYQLTENIFNDYNVDLEPYYESLKIAYTFQLNKSYINNK